MPPIGVIRGKSVFSSQLAFMREVLAQKVVNTMRQFRGIVGAAL